MGGKTMCLHNNVNMDINWWNSIRIEKMKTCILLRLKYDNTFRLIIENIRKNHIVLVHFSRNDMFWGGKIQDDHIIGANILGNILTSIDI